MPRSTDCVGRIFRGRPQVLYKAHIAGHRIFSSCSRSAQEIELASPPPPPPSQGIPDPQTASTLAEEAALKRAGIWPIGSRRRRVALANSQNIPFEQLPYQCFQEARKVLLEDRRDKLQQIERQRHKIQNLRARAVSEEVHTIPRQAESARRNSITSSQHYLYKLKILADINDPLVKKRFEDGKGDLSRPIYRYLADRKWRSRRRPILMQRLTQMNVVPDVLREINPTVDVDLSFHRLSVHPGDFVTSTMSQYPPRITIQPFNGGRRLVTILMIDPDVPNVETDSFNSRGHFVAVNVPISPTQTVISTSDIPDVEAMPNEAMPSKGQLLEQWKPPFAQKGSPYHRLCLLILEQSDEKPVDGMTVKKALLSDQKNTLDFSAKRLISRYGMVPVGAFLFRTRWDEGTDALMYRLGAEGAGVELKPRRVLPLPYKKKPSDGAKYR